MILFRSRPVPVASPSASLRWGMSRSSVGPMIRSMKSYGLVRWNASTPAFGNNCVGFFQAHAYWINAKDVSKVDGTPYSVPVDSADRFRGALSRRMAGRKSGWATRWSVWQRGTSAACFVIPLRADRPLGSRHGWRVGREPLSRLRPPDGHHLDCPELGNSDRARARRARRWGAARWPSRCRPASCTRPPFCRISRPRRPSRFSRRPMRPSASASFGAVRARLGDSARWGVPFRLTRAIP